MNSGNKDTQDMEKRAPQELSPVASTNIRNASETVNLEGELRYIIWDKKSFQVQMKVKIATVTRAGLDKGITILA